MLPKEELLESMNILAQNAVKDSVKIYTAIVKTVGKNNTCSIKINGKTHSDITYYGVAPSVNKAYRVFLPNGSMNQAFIITGGGGSSGGGGTTDYNQLTNRPSINSVTLSGNQSSSQLGLYGENNQPPYPVTSVNGQTGDVVISSGGNVDSVNGKTGTVVLTASDVGALPDTTEIPSKTSQLENDSGYITSSALSGYAKTSDIPTKTSQLDNNSGFITANDVPVKSVDGATGDVVTNAVKTTAQNLTDTQKQQARENIGAGTSSFDGDYNSLSNQPTIPTKTSDITNDSGYITSADVPVKSVNGKTGEVQLIASDVGAIPSPASMGNNQWLKTDATGNVITSNLPDASTGSKGITYLVNAYNRTDTDKAVTPKALNDVYKLIPEVTETLGTSTDKVPSEKAVSDALASAGAGDMLKSVYDKDDSVASAGGIADYVSANSGKIDVIKVNGTEQTITDKSVDIAVPTNNNQLTNGAGYITASGAPVQSVNGKTGTVQLGASDVGALPDSTVIPSKTSQLDNDSGFITDIPIASATQLGGVKIGAGLSVTSSGVLSATGGGTADAVEWDNVLDKPTTIAGYGITDAKIDNGTITLGDKTITPLTSAPVTSVNSKTGNVVLSASDVGAIGTDDISQTLGTSTTKVPSEKAVSDALSAAGAGDMLKSTYDPDGSVATAGGIPDYVEANGGKIDTIKVNGTAQTITDKTVDISVPTKTSDLTNDSGYLTEAPVSSVNGKIGAVEITADDVGALAKPATITANKWFKTDTNGAVALSDLPNASTGSKGITYLVNTYNRTDTDKAATAKALNDVYKLIPTVNDATLTIRRNGTDVGSFTANSANDVNVDINVPTDKSDIGLGNVDNVKQYSASNPPPYPVTSVNGKTGDVMIDVSGGGTQVKIVRW